MRFSETFSVSRKGPDDWFDVVLSADTRLFVDPFRIYVEKQESWSSAHDRLVAFFNVVLKQVAKAGNDPRSAHLAAARRLVQFPEPSEFCLGYGDTPLGAGTGEGIAENVLKAAKQTIALGVEAIEHFEELTLFEHGIGADRISDIVCNVLKREFIAYTSTVAKRHSVPTADIPVPHASWNEEHEIWEDSVVSLPMNPFTGRAVLLTPERFLRKLPSIEPEDFWDWSWSNENENIRGQFNYDLGKNVDARTIARFARVNSRLTKKYIKSVESSPKPPYDMETDEGGETSWHEAGSTVAAQLAYGALPAKGGEFCSWVKSLLDDFAHNVSEQDGWRLLWHGSKPRAERYAQALLRTALWQICKANDVDFTGEPNAGRGPADFKFSQGWSKRALVEVKLTNNSRFWHGLQEQTPQYMKSEQIDCGFFVSVGYRDADFDQSRQSLVKDAAKKVSAELGARVTPVFVDARPKRSASKAAS